MSLKTATMLAFMGLLVTSALSILTLYDLLQWSLWVSLAHIVLGNGTLALFLGVLYARQK